MGQTESQVRPHNGALRYTVSSDSIMTRRSIDLIGPLPEDKDGHKWICSITRPVCSVQLPLLSDNYFSRRICPLTSHRHFGAPLFLVSDNGTQYVNEFIAKLLDNMAVIQIQPTPYSHQENSGEENAHKESIRHLRSILFAGADLRQWAIAAPLAQRLVNTQEMESIGCSPNQMVRGNTLDTNKRLFQHFVPL